MKRLFTSGFIMLISAFIASASPMLRYEPSIGINGGANISAFNDSVETEHNARINGVLGIKADFLALGINNHRISIPLYLNYDSESGAVAYKTVQLRISAGIRLEYSAALTEMIYLALSAGARYDWFYRVHGSMWYLDIAAEPGFRPIEMLSISLPVSVSFSKLGYEADIRAAVTFHLDSLF